MARNDLRDGPMRSDPEFENRSRTQQLRTLAGFARVAVLVRTAVGKLQVSRARRESGHSTEGIFHDEAEALAYLARPRKLT